MKQLSKALPCLIALSTLFSTASAHDASPAQETIPGDLWKPQAGIIEMAIFLKTNTGKDKLNNEIDVYIKNISTSVQALAVSAKSDHGFSFFTKDSNGNEHLLHDRNPPPADDSSLQEQLQNELGIAGSSHIDRIPPGETIMRATEISAEELVLLQKYPLKCRFSIIEPDSGKAYHIESKPEILEKR